MCRELGAACAETWPASCQLASAAAGGQIEPTGTVVFVSRAELWGEVIGASKREPCLRCFRGEGTRGMQEEGMGERSRGVTEKVRGQRQEVQTESAEERGRSTVCRPKVQRRGEEG